MNIETSVQGPKLLVSVRNAGEVEAAVAGGADWIDLKEPAAGPLAGVEVEIAREAVESVAGRRPLSAALGELRDWPNSPTVGLLEVAGISVVKLGLAGCAKRGGWQQDGWQQEWLKVAKDSAEASKELVAVVYADWQQAEAPAPEEILQLAQAVECRYLLIDTYDKRGGSTLDYLPPAKLGPILRTARQALLTTVVAGSLSLESLGELPLEDVDVIAVRGAVCRGDRTGVVEAELVRAFRDVL